MKNEPIRMAFTFDEYMSQLIREAAKTTISCYDELDARRDHRRIINLAVIAYCRGIIKLGKPANPGEIDLPMMAELRPETKEECRARVAGEMPNETNLSNPAFKALHAKDEELAKKVQGMGNDEVLEMINHWEIYALVASGRADKIPAKAPRFAAEFSAQLCALSKKARVKYAEGVRNQIADLREYLENLKNPDSIKPDSTLSAAELRYCEAENIVPVDFLKAKERK